VYKTLSVWFITAPFLRLSQTYCSGTIGRKYWRHFGISRRIPWRSTIRVDIQPLCKTGRGGDSEPARPLPADEPNVVSESLGAQTVNGVQADGTRRTRTIPAGAIGNVSAIQIVQETWFSPDLQVPVLVKVTDPRSGVTVRELTNINPTEPDAALFQTPAGYSILRAAPRKGPR
jgi:hypothetical protein